MRYSTKTVGGTVEILAADTFTGIPVCLAPSDTVYKAGTPIDDANAAALDGDGAVGILLYDVDTSINPNGTIVVAGVIDYNKIVANAGVTASVGDLKDAMPAICFRSNINVQNFGVRPTTMTLDVGDTDKIEAIYGVAPYTVVSSNTSVATVQDFDEYLEARVEGIAEGSATITVTDATGKKVSVAVTVTAD